jgi:hypothetical protein
MILYTLVHQDDSDTSIVSVLDKFVLQVFGLEMDGVVF